MEEIDENNEDDEENGEENDDLNMGDEEDDEFEEVPESFEHKMDTEDQNGEDDSEIIQQYKEKFSTKKKEKQEIKKANGNTRIKTSKKKSPNKSHILSPNTRHLQFINNHDQLASSLFLGVKISKLGISSNNSGNLSTFLSKSTRCKAVACANFIIVNKPEFLIFSFSRPLSNPATKASPAPVALAEAFFVLNAGVK